MYFSSDSTTLPTLLKISTASFEVLSVAYVPLHTALIPSLTNAGVFGITLIIGTLPTISSIVFIEIPAAIEIIVCSSVM